MKVTKQQTETYLLTNIETLDPVTAYVTNYRLGQGKIVIECYGESWAHYWPAMGDMTLQQFFLSANNDYLATKLIRGDGRQTDFEEINEIASKRGYDICVTSDVEIAYCADEMAECFGGDWCMDLPRCYTTEYKHLCRIISMIKAAF